MIRVGIIDSGISSANRRQVLASLNDGVANGLHANAVASAILKHCPEAQLLDAAILDHRLSCATDTLIDAIRWVLDEGATVVNLSLGLRRDVPELDAVCRAAWEAGCVLVASMPAQGAIVYPAAYETVVSASGDARCMGTQITAMGTDKIDFAGCVRDHETGLAGSSIGCANVSGAIAKIRQDAPALSNQDVLTLLGKHAAYRGPEKR